MPLKWKKEVGACPNRREENWRRVLKTATPYGLNMDKLVKFINCCTILCTF